MNRNIEEKQMNAETASYVIHKLEKWFELAEPTERLMQLKDIVSGDTILDSVSNYIMLYGYTPEFQAIFEEQRQIYLKEKNKSFLVKCAEKSLASLGAKVENGKKGIKEFAKKHYKEAIAIFLATALTASTAIVIRIVNRKKELIKASEDIVTLYDQEYNYNAALSEIKTENKNARIPDTDFHMFLIQHNFTRDEIVYLTNIYDKVSFKRVLEYYGYSNLKDYLRDYYFVEVYSGSENPIVLYKEPSYRKFENAVEESIKAKAELLKESYGINLKDSKGIGLK